MAELPLNHIQNNEEGLSVRDKLNTVIDRTNATEGIESLVDVHVNDKTNPHDVKAPQVGLDPALQPLEAQNVQAALQYLWTRMASATVSDEMPKDPAPGDMWIDTETTMEMYVYIEGNGWISMTGAGGGMGGALPNNIVIDDMDGLLSGKLLGREADEDGKAAWRPIYTDDVLTRGAQPMFRKPNGQFAKKTDPEAVRDQQTANWFLYESMMDLNGGVQVSEDAPVDPNDGALWFDNTEEIMQLFLYHEDSDAWIPVAPPTTIEGRVREGEATQQEIIKQIEVSLEEQRAIRDRVAAGEARQSEIASQITVSLEEQTAMRNKVAEIDQAVGALEPVDVSGLATTEYVDTKVSATGTNQLPDDTDWKIKQHTSEGKNKTLIHSVGGQLGVYNLKEPVESHHAATKSYVDSRSNAGAGVSASRPPGLKFMCSIVNLPNGYFQWWVKESTGNQHLELATTDRDGIAWGTNTPREDVKYTHHQPFTIWEVSGGGWKMRVTGTISRIDFHPDHALCYVSSKTALNGGNFANGSGPYYITISGIF
jgi:hypothetical protein